MTVGDYRNHSLARESWAVGDGENKLASMNSLPSVFPSVHGAWQAPSGS